MTLLITALGYLNREETSLLNNILTKQAYLYQHITINQRYPCFERIPYTAAKLPVTSAKATITAAKFTILLVLCCYFIWPALPFTW